MKPLLTTALALFVAAAPASAQDLVAANASTIRVAADDTPRVPARLVRALNSMSADTRADAMHQMLTLAFGSPRGVDLSPVTADLMSIFETDTDARHRILALRLLQALDSDEVMAALHENAHEETNPAVQRVLYSALLDHYGADWLRRDDHAVGYFRALNADLQG
ncbi:MAG: hypothetical protein AAF845_05175 [Bacteroidota bacterium]